MKKLLVIIFIALMVLAFPSTIFSKGQQEEKAGDELIIYHWWTAGGEKEAIDALFALFNEQYPDIKIIENPVAGGGGGTMRGQIKTMVMANQSPDTFQLTYGTGMLASFAEIIEPIDELFENFPVPEMVKYMGTVDGHQVSIPINIMRNNCLWYNKKLVNELGVDVSFKNFDEFYTACEKIKNAGYIPYAIGAGGGQQFWWAQITEQVILGALHGGPDYIDKLYSGMADPSNDPAIREMFEFVKTIIDRGYINSDYSALTWDQASDLLMTEKAVFYQMGDWAKGHFTSAGWKPKVDFDYVVSPGTEGFFTLHFDGFSLCKGAPHPDAVMKWLKLLTTAEAENAFCTIKGATPPRLDAKIDAYDDISKDILKDFRDPNTKIVQSAWAQPPEAWLGMYGSLFSGFAENTDIEKGIQDYTKAYKKVFNK